ncbi:hypothetical protein Hanom_Chr10g00899511 [Helianthus anomalus]
MKMTTKLKPQGPRFKKFEFWTKVAKVTKPQGPFWQFTLQIIVFCLFKSINIVNGFTITILVELIWHKI